MARPDAGAMGWVVVGIVGVFWCSERSLVSWGTLCFASAVALRAIADQGQSDRPEETVAPDAAARAPSATGPQGSAASAAEGSVLGSAARDAGGASIEARSAAGGGSGGAAAPGAVCGTWIGASASLGTSADTLASLAARRLSLDKLVTHRIAPAELGTAYEGLLKKKEEYLGVVVRWQ